MRMNELVQLLRGCEIPTERLLDHQTGPTRAGVKACRCHAFDRAGEHARRQGEVEDPVAGQLCLALDGLDARAQSRVLVCATGRHGLVVEMRVTPGGHLLLIVAGGRQGLLRPGPVGRVVHLGGPGDRENSVTAVYLPIARQLEYGRQELARGKVSSAAEDDQEVRVDSAARHQPSSRFTA